MAVIALDIGGTKILGALFDKSGTIIDKEKKPSKGEEGFEVFLNQIHRVIDNIIKRNDQKLEGIGIGVPGIVNQNGKVLFTPNLPIENFEMAKHLKDRYNVPIKIGNDVNLGTYGEYYELGIKHGNVIGLFPGTGLGGGIVIEGKLYIGQGFAGELGHIVVQKDGVQCGCGNYGCLESYASKKGIIRFIKSQIDLGRDTILKEDILNGILKSSKLRDACEKEDELALAAMEQFKEYLGMGVGIIMNIFNPDIILLGGGIIEAFGDELLVDIKAYAKAYAMKGIFQNTKIKKSHLGDDAVIYGAYHLV